VTGLDDDRKRRLALEEGYVNITEENALSN